MMIEELYKISKVLFMGSFPTALGRIGVVWLLSCWIVWIIVSIRYKNLTISTTVGLIGVIGFISAVLISVYINQPFTWKT